MIIVLQYSLNSLILSYLKVYQSTKTVWHVSIRITDSFGTIWPSPIRQTLNDTEESLVPAVPNGTEPFRTWADSITGACRVPSAIKLNIMYTQTGAVNGYPRDEIVGAYIRWVIWDWGFFPSLYVGNQLTPRWCLSAPQHQMIERCGLHSKFL